MFSGGKDSIVASYLARKAFYPAPIPFTFLHVDTGHNFPETIRFRDEWVKELGAELIVRYVQDSIDKGRVSEESGIHASRNALQTTTLVDAIEELKVDAAIGGARRDEEKSRAKERFFSHRDEFGQWEPRNQRPELWSLFNGHHRKGEHFRIFPLSNWTEIDIWQYIKKENIRVPEIYFSHERDVFVREGNIYAFSDFVQLGKDEHVSRKVIRFRTIGDMTCTGAVESVATNLEDIIREVATSRYTERGSRIDDQRSETSLEDRKRAGYF